MASSLTIAPSLGHSLVTAQGMPGGYDAIDDRSFWSVSLQEGAVESGAYKVTQRAAGANLTVDVAVDDGHVVVQGDDVTNQGLYVVRPHPTVANLDIATAHGTNPRIDSVVVQIEDDEHDSSGQTRARVMVLTGTATSGADLDDRLGAPTLPDSAVLLADVLVPALDTSISNSQIRDRRKWARGAYFQQALSSGGDRTRTSTSLDFIDGTNWRPRIECSGKPLRVTISGDFLYSAADANRGVIELNIDGSSQSLSRSWHVSVASGVEAGTFTFDLTPSAGSHLIGPVWAATTSGTVTLKVGTGAGGIASNPVMVIEEVVRDSARNDSVTSG